MLHCADLLDGDLMGRRRDGQQAIAAQGSDAEPATSRCRDHLDHGIIALSVTLTLGVTNNASGKA